MVKTPLSPAAVGRTCIDSVVVDSRAVVCFDLVEPPIVVYKSCERHAIGRKRTDGKTNRESSKVVGSKRDLGNAEVI